MKFRVIKFGAEWCGPCKSMIPIFNKIEEDYKNNQNIEFVHYDIEEDVDETSQFKIMSVPTFVVVNEKNEVLGKVTGSMPETKLREFININIKTA